MLFLITYISPEFSTRFLVNGIRELKNHDDVHDDDVC